MTRRLLCTATCLALCWCFGPSANADGPLPVRKARRGGISNKAFPQPQSQANIGAPRGPGLLVTDFEAADGWVVGDADGQNGWGENADTTDPAVFSISTDNPQSGTQHIRTVQDTSGPAAGTLRLLFSPDLGPLLTGPSVTTIHVRASNTGGANYTIVGQSPSEGFLTWRIDLDFQGDIFVLDGSFVDTGFTWPVDQYFELRVEHYPASGQISYYVNGTNIYNQANGNVGGTRVEQVIFGHDNFQLANEEGDFDNLSLMEITGGGACCDTNTGTCTEVSDVGNCAGAGFVFSAGQTCANVVCEIANGACCSSTTQECTDNVDIGDCEASGGHFGGNGSTCATFDCPEVCSPGSSGQPGDGQANNTDGIISVASDSNPADFGPDKVADNFVPTVSGTITSVRWWGEYLTTGFADCPVSDGDSPDDFTITYYFSNSNGTTNFPGIVVGGPFSVTPTKVDTGLTDVAGSPFFRYEATHPGVDVEAGFCYWIEIVNHTTANCTWFWVCGDGSAGDEVCALTTDDTYDESTVSPFAGDLSWCINIDVNTDGCLSATPIPGACCLFQATACMDSDVDQCGQLGGSFVGPLTTCSDPGAADYCKGACCAEGTCNYATEFDCQQIFGSVNFFGIDSDCTEPNPCQVFACCDANGQCNQDLDFLSCTGLPGAWLPGQHCNDSPDCATNLQGFYPTMGCNDTFETNNSVVADSGQTFSCALDQTTMMPIPGSGDFWVKFVATDDSALISLANSDVLDTLFEVFTGPDDFTLTALPNGCIDDTPDSLNPELCIETTPGTTYYIHVASFDNQPAELGAITVEVTCPCPATCDTCPGDVNGDTKLDGADVQQFTRCLIGAEGNPDLCVCADMNNDDVANTEDITAFVDAILAGGYCPGFPEQFCDAGSNGQLPDLANSLFSAIGEGSQMIADNFDTSGGTITKIEWWGGYDDNCPDITDSFTITIFNDDGNGAPGTVNTTLTNQVPTRTATGRLFDFGANGTPEEYRYVLSGLSIPLGQGCYWLGISNADTPSGCTWSWETSVDGDTIIGAHLAGDPPGYQRIEGFDVAWCLDIAIGDNSTCTLPQGACCVSGNCQATTDQDDCETNLGGTWFIGEDCASFVCPQPGADNCTTPTPVSDGSTQVDLSLGTDSGIPACGDFPFGDDEVYADQWYEYTASCTGTLFVDTCGTQIDTRLAVYGAGVTCTQITSGALPVECNDDHGEAAEGDTGHACDYDFSASLSTPVTMGSTYIIRVGTFGTAPQTGIIDLNIECAPGGVGACCVGTTCMDITGGETECGGMGGVYQGDATACASIVCGGACCLPNGTCGQAVDASDCLDDQSGLFYYGDGSQCSDDFVVCPGVGQCLYFLVLWDDFGDGWNFNGNVNSIEVYLNGNPVFGGGGVTLPNGTGPAQANFVVTPGDVITTTYTGGDGFEVENTWAIFDSQGNLVCTDGTLNADDAPDETPGLACSTAVCP